MLGSPCWAAYGVASRAALALGLRLGGAREAGDAGWDAVKLRQAPNQMKTTIIPEKFQTGDQIRVLALSRSLGGLKQYPGFTDADIEFGRNRVEALGLRVTFGQHVMEGNAHLTTSVESRLEDLRAALTDPSVKGILSVSGGMGAIQLVDQLDYDLIAAHPKVFSGYSDNGFLWNAIYARTGLVSYYGPNFSSFMNRKDGEYTGRSFQTCLFNAQPFDVVPATEWSDDNWVKDQENRTFLPNEGWWAVNEGEAEGTIVGGSYYTLNMLKGSEYFPPLQDAILFLEHPSTGKTSLMDLDMGLRALSFLPQFKQVRGIVIGRFARNARIDREKLTSIIQSIAAAAHIPVAANCDFGHTTPMMTVPIGGRCRLRVGGGKTEIVITQH